MIRRPAPHEAKTPQFCFPACEFFNCSQKHLQFQRGVEWCKLADDRCTPKDCKFAHCIRAKLLPNGICGFTIRARSIELEPERLAQPIKAPPKLAQKIHERELF